MSWRLLLPIWSLCSPLSRSWVGEGSLHCQEKGLLTLSRSIGRFAIRITGELPLTNISPDHSRSSCHCPVRLLSPLEQP